jgi:hypothetical protein
VISQCGRQSSRELEGLARELVRIVLFFFFYKSEGTNINFNNSSILQNLFIWNNGKMNNLDLELHTAREVSTVSVRKPHG